MADIKTRDTVKGTIRTLDKGRIAASRMKQAYIQTKDKAEHSVEPEEHNETEYASDRMESGTKRVAEETVHQTKKAINKGAEKVKDKVERKIEDRVKKKVENKAENTAKDTVKNSAERAYKNAAKKSTEKSIRATNSAGRKSIRTVEKTSAKTVKQSARSTGKATVKTAQKGTVKTVKTSVKTAEKTSKAAIKTTKQAAKAAEKSAKAASKAAQKAAKAAQQAAKLAAKAAKAAIQLLIKIIKAIIAALQKLISAIIAGGWVSLLVILIICMIALICWSVYGLFASANANEGEYTMHNIITRINNEFNEKITDIKTDIIADSVGLGKTFEALAVIKYFSDRQDNILVLTPAKLYNNWDSYRDNDYEDNPLADDVIKYKVLCHTDLSRYSGISRSGIDLERFDWSRFDLIVIDESHNFRNRTEKAESETRYQRLLETVVKKKTHTKVLLLSATPVNNSLTDLKNQISLITGDQDDAFEKYGIESISQTLRKASSVFNAWERSGNASKEELYDTLPKDFFDLLELLTISRSRKHITNYYNSDDIGTFPNKLPVSTYNPNIDTDSKLLNFKETLMTLEELLLAAYTPMRYIKREYQARSLNKYREESTLLQRQTK
ncbi:hypothetical protein ACTQ3J_10695 [Oscillospiraceae bacterium LCP25S3_E3]